MCGAGCGKAVPSPPWDSVRVFIAGLGRMDFIAIHVHLRLNFYKGSCTSINFVYSSIIRLFNFYSISKRSVINEYVLNLSFDELKCLLLTNFCIDLAEVS